MTRLSGLLLALMIGGGFCLLLVLGNAVMAVLCRVHAMVVLRTGMDLLG